MILLQQMLHFLIYKQWLQLSYARKCQESNVSFLYFKNELKLRLYIYKLCKPITIMHKHNIQQLLDSIIINDVLYIIISSGEKEAQKLFIGMIIINEIT